jgi:hypothetical protein
LGPWGRRWEWRRRWGIWFGLSGVWDLGEKRGKEEGQGGNEGSQRGSEEGATGIFGSDHQGHVCGFKSFPFLSFSFFLFLFEAPPFFYFLLFYFHFLYSTPVNKKLINLT